MPINEKQLTDWYEKGLIGEDDLDRSVGKLRELAEKYRSAVSRRRVTMTEAQKHELAVRAAEESAVLLKNDDDILPVCRDKRIAVIGGFAENPEFQGGGSSRVNAKAAQTLCDCLKQLGFNADFALGYMIRYNLLTPFGIRYAVETAAKNDCAVVCVGNTWLTEKEETDRFSLKLNPAAEDLILDVAQVNPNVIVVIYAGSAVDVSAFEGKVKAILYMGYCGEGANEAAADLISGRVSPCGKLAETFPKCLEDTATADRRGNGYTERYPEGVLVGYKYYEYNGIAPAYPFGYGLSYTTFRYGDMQVKKLGETDYHISFSVQNVGRHAAAEIVQVYISDDASMVTRPRKELVAFGKKRLEVGETCTFGFHLTERDFAYFSPVLNEFYVENGTFTISIGASSADIRLQEKVEIELPDEKQFSRY